MDYLHYVHFLSIVENDFKYLDRPVRSNGKEPDSSLVKKWKNAFDAFMATPFFILRTPSSASKYYREAHESLDKFYE